ncbi:MAG: trehalose-binding protein [Desulfovibrio sp.]|nr:trehalose-binding protein [Desulfovibrio sp.]
MHIDTYTFDEFRTLAEQFHGYAAPGLLIGAYMVAKAKQALPQGTLFEAIVETDKCLPDAVQLLTLCSTGNRRMKVFSLGRYALALFDKYTGKGVRASLDCTAMRKWPEIAAWFFKEKPKQEQDTQLLERQIEEAGDSYCRLQAIHVLPHYVGHSHMQAIVLCPVCGEAYPKEDGPICRGCQGDAPYSFIESQTSPTENTNATVVVPVEEAVGKTLAHDMTRIVPGQFKGPEFAAGQTVRAGDICRLQQMGRFNVAVLDEEKNPDSQMIHENQVAETFARRMAGANVNYTLPPHEGKIDFTAAIDGVFCVDWERLYHFNLIPKVMCASRQNGLMVSAGSRLAGTRAIPLYLDNATMNQALTVLGEKPLFWVAPMRQAKVGILVTGTEVFQGLIEDKFIPIITAKMTNLHCQVVAKTIAPDNITHLQNALSAMIKQGIDLLITTGGLSVDPDDVTREALLQAGLTNTLHGIPVLPGTMTLLGEITKPGYTIQVIGVPACALYFKTTAFDLLIPRLLANQPLTRAELARMGEGGYCMGCQNCTWPKCWFGK